MHTLRAAALVTFWAATWALLPAAQEPAGQETVGQPAKKDGPLKDNTFAIKELEKKVWHIAFAPDKKAELTITSANEADVDLFVEEMDGTEVIEDIDPSQNCMIEFTPRKHKTYRVSVVNLGPGDNQCTFTHNGKVEQPSFGKTAQTKPVKIGEDGNHTLDVNLAEGKWSAVWVFGKSATDVDVFVFDPDGNEIAADEHVSKDAFVSFLPKSSGSYRIEVRNLGPGENECTVKHTVADKAK
jgi:hypothetical protein